MTRINVIPVEELMDQHLIAEYRELPRVSSCLLKSIRSKAGFNRKRISPVYTLNTGHVYFFYDKGAFLEERYRQLVEEMRKRGFKPDYRKKFGSKVFKENGLYNNWTPDEEAMRINRERIQLRINSKPSWYRKTNYK